MVFFSILFALSTASAFGLKKLADLITDWYRRSEGLQRFLHSMKKACIVLLAIAVVFTVFMGVRRAQLTRNAEAKYEEFRAENITMVNAGGREAAVYTGSSETAGEADAKAPAIVFFSSDSRSRGRTALSRRRLQQHRRVQMVPRPLCRR